MCSLITAWECAFWIQNVVFSYNRMCSLTTECCVLLPQLENVLSVSGDEQVILVCCVSVWVCVCATACVWGGGWIGGTCVSAQTQMCVSFRHTCGYHLLRHTRSILSSYHSFIICLAHWVSNDKKEIPFECQMISNIICWDTRAVYYPLISLFGTQDHW